MADSGGAARGKGKGTSSDRKAKISGPPPMRYKLVVRKLPPAREFNEQEFQSNLTRVVTQLGLAADAVHVEHFVGGKLRYVLHHLNPKDIIPEYTV